MGVVKAHTWKELIEHAEIVEKSTKKLEPSVPKNKWRVNNKGRDTTQSFQTKGKEKMVVELSKKLRQSQKGVALTTIWSLNFLKNNTPLRMSKW